MRLKQLTDWLRAHPSSKIVITGLTQGGDDPLAQMRAALLRAEQLSTRLVSAGVPIQRIFIEGANQDRSPTGAGVSVRAMSRPGRAAGKDGQ